MVSSKTQNVATNLHPIDVVLTSGFTRRDFGSFINLVMGLVKTACCTRQVMVNNFNFKFPSYNLFSFRVRCYLVTNSAQLLRLI